MAFQAPRIVGGGQIVSRPNTYQDPGSRMVDAYNQGADRNLKKKALELEAKNLYADMDVATPGEGHVPFEEWYGGDQQGGGGGLLGMVKGMFPGKGGSQQTSGLPFDPDDPASVKKYQADNGLTVDGVVGPKTMDKAKQTSFQAPDRPSPLNPDYQEPEQWKGRPSPELSSMQRAGNWMKENVFNQKGFQGEGGGSGQGPLQTAPESDYQKQLHGGTAQKRDPYGYGNAQEDTSGAPKENIFTKAKDFITRPSNRKYESATEEGREMVKNLDLSDNDAVARFQETMGMEADGIAGKNTLAAIRALQSGEHERATSGYRPDYQITGIGKQQGGYSLVGGGDLPGKRTGDKNPAMLEDGEYVLNRNAVKALGKGFLDHINDERYPRFQSGGFNEPDIAGGTAQIAQPGGYSAPFSSSAVGSGGEEGGGDEDKMAMAMKFAPMLFGAPPMQRGGYMPGYQGGGFQRPQIQGQQAQMAQPGGYNSPFGAGAVGGGEEGGNDPVITQTTTPEGGQTTGDFSNVELDDWQSGGHVPKYQQGGTVRRPTGYQTGGRTGYRPSTRTGMITNEELEQSQRNEDWKGDVRRMGAGYNYDVNKYQQDIDETYKDAGISHWNPLNLIPGVWDKEQYQEEAQRHKDEYARDHMGEAFDPSRVPSNVRMDEEGYQLLKHHGGIPEQSNDARLSSDALKKKWWESMNPDTYSGSDWIEQWFPKK